MKKTIFLLAVILYTFSSFANKADSLKVKKVLKNRLAEINAVNSNKYKIKQIDIINDKGQPLIYIGQLKPAGYILVSAAENAVPVLGGSLGKNFCMDSIAPGLRYLIKSYKEEILYLAILVSIPNIKNVIMNV